MDPRFSQQWLWRHEAARSEAAEPHCLTLVLAGYLLGLLSNTEHADTWNHTVWRLFLLDLLSNTEHANTWNHTVRHLFLLDLLSNTEHADTWNHTVWRLFLLATCLTYFPTLNMEAAYYSKLQPSTAILTSVTADRTTGSRPSLLTVRYEMNLYDLKESVCTNSDKMSICFT
jgi:hypothetical protein